MKTLLSLFLLLALGASAATGIKISEYPNTPVLTNSELFIVAVTNVTPATNRNISYGQLRSLLASNNFVGSFTGDGRGASNVVASYVAGTLSNNISGNAGTAGMATNLANGLEATSLVVGGNIAYRTNGANAFWDNSIFGVGAGGNSQATNHPITIYGGGSGWALKSASFVDAFGVNTLPALVDGDHISAFGTHALSVATNGQYTAAFGVGALEHSYFPINNTALGFYSFVNLIDGNDNTAIGAYTPLNMLHGSNNFFGGSATAYTKQSGSWNLQLGYQSGDTDVSANSDTNGSFNTWVGVYSGPGVAQATSLTNSAALGFRSKPVRSNQSVIGSDSTLETILSGKVGIGTNTPHAGLELMGDGSSDSLRVGVPGTPDAFRIAANGNIYHWSHIIFNSTGDQLQWPGGQAFGYGALGAAGLYAYAHTGPFTVSTHNGSEVGARLIVSQLGDTTAYGNISSSGSIIATNAFVMPPVADGPAWCTNGLAAMWNSNGVSTYIRTSAVGATTYADKLMAP